MTHNHKRRYSAPVNIMEMHTKTTIRYHLTAVRRAVVKMPTNNKCWRECEPSYTAGGNVKCYNNGTKTAWGSSKTSNRTTVGPNNPTLGYNQKKKTHTNSKRHMHPNVHNSIIYDTQDMKLTQVSINQWMYTENVIYIYIYIYRERERERERDSHIYVVLEKTLFL